MRILFLGDVVGRAGRAAIVNQLSDLRQAWKLDFVVVNAENATSGAGLNAAHAKAILEAGADCITLGDHAFYFDHIATALAERLIQRITRASERLFKCTISAKRTPI